MFLEYKKERDSIYYEVIEGNNKDTSFDAVILLHSLGVDSRLWKYQKKVIAEISPKVVLVDSRGHGKSRVDSGIDREKWIEDIKYLCDTLTLKKVILCGISMGGVQAIGFSIKYPEYVEGLILADTFAKIPEQVEEKINLTAGIAKREGMGRYGSIYLDNTLSDSSYANKIREELNDAIINMSVDDYYESAKACFTVDYEGRLQEIHVPTLVLIGEKDMKTPIALSQMIQTQIPNSILLTIPEGMHLSNVDNPTDFNRIVTGFIQML
ncbi:alpha/beta fold hydrolase [Robertmurraya massiliosenegalensis]|uniref:alpha/beta fold hydrolase n=1 Tax=Robertmurraya massiliosenegalensis TaxID=1287657 RepID=UPI00031E1188|nr:alpha/beta fold hydrolase [Robertmurraya massiliosenegalensis]